MSVCEYCGGPMGYGPLASNLLGDMCDKCRRDRKRLDKPSGIYLTHNECNVLMHGLRDADDDVLQLKPEAQRVYERLVLKIIDAGTEPGGGGEHELMSLNSLAAECHRLAVARGKYPEGWTYYSGMRAITDEAEEWNHAQWTGEEEDAILAEFGDTVHAVLSVGHHMGYDIEQVLRDAMERNRVRAEEDA